MSVFFGFEGVFGMQKLQGIDKKAAFFVKGFTINSEYDERFAISRGLRSVSVFLSGYLIFKLVIFE